jgi:HlyD family secretion protein
VTPSIEEDTAQDNAQDIGRTLGLDADRPPGRRRWWILAAVALAAVIGLLVWAPWRGPAVRFVVEPAQTMTIRATVTATGTLRPLNQVDVGAEISGQIDAVLVDFNSRVQQGDVMARLNTEALEARVAQSSAQLAVARARVSDAQASLREQRLRTNRTRELAKSGFQSQANVDTATAALARAEAALKSAEAQVRQAEATLKVDETNLTKAEIRAPISGVVISRKIEPGQTVAATFQTPILFTLAEDLARMELLLDVDEADIGLVREGQEASFIVDAYPGRVFPAKITAVRNAPKTVQNVVSYEVVLSVDNPFFVLRPGMTATATIIVDMRENVLAVSNTSLRFAPPDQPPVRRLFPSTGETPGQRGVWVLRGRTPARLAVTTGLTDGRWTEITGGDLAAGQEVVIDVLSRGQTRPEGSPGTVR